MGTATDAIEHAITEHLRRHPLAADSALGVARWWLPPDLRGATEEQVQQVLDALVARGLLRRLRLSDGGVLYALPAPTRQ